MKPHTTRHTEAAQIREALRNLELDSCTSARARDEQTRARAAQVFAMNAPAGLASRERLAKSQLPTLAPCSCKTPHIVQATFGEGRFCLDCGGNALDGSYCAARR